MGVEPPGRVRGFRLNPDIAVELPGLDDLEVVLVQQRASRARRRHRPSQAVQSDILIDFPGLHSTRTSTATAANAGKDAADASGASQAST
jgi:hypothetical protein